MAVNIENSIVTKIGVCPFNHGRANIRPLVDSVEQKGFVPYIDPQVARVNPVGQDYLGKFAERKIDLYTVTVPIVKQVMDTAIAARVNFPPFGLVTRKWEEVNGIYVYKPVESFQTRRPFMELEAGIDASLNRALELDYNGNRVVRSEQPRLQSVYDAFDDIATASKQRMPQDLISNGIATAARVTAKTLEVIPRVFARDFPDAAYSPEQFGQIAENSYSFVAFLAGKHKDFTLPVISFFEDNNRSMPFNPDYFTIRNNKLIFSDIAKERIKQIIREHYTTPEIGCPALYSDALRRLWGWGAGIASYIYTNYRPEADNAVNWRIKRFAA